MINRPLFLVTYLLPISVISDLFCNDALLWEPPILPDRSLKKLFPFAWLIVCLHCFNFTPWRVQRVHYCKPLTVPDRLNPDTFYRKDH